MRPTKESGKLLKKYVDLSRQLGKFPTRTEFEPVVSERQVRKHFGSFTGLKSKVIELHPEFSLPIFKKNPKILVFDIETSAIIAEVWGLRDQNIGLNQVIENSYVIAWAAKWLDDPPSKVMYMDQSKSKNLRNNKKLISGLVKLLNEADIVVSQNGIRFDSRMVNTEVEHHDLEKPSSYRHHDLLKTARKYLNLPSYKLEYMSNRFNKKYKKLKHKKFPGHDLWRECRKGNKEAWEVMKDYNVHDVLATEELYNRFKKWFFRKYS